ncbi:MAG TPA: phosphate ABC transporter substrate-binding protein PstS [Candidatus Sulfopaludibacter sp.]|jgi:phosphate transport system substrate-binding protein|nr:phosphate ABC transporter substrate-binding protein PstS [Candidatus Sulfopaludibacter sp.]
MKINNQMVLVTMAALGLAGIAAAQSLNGAGATFPNPIYTKWFEEYRKAHPGVEINYQSIGSGGGITALTNQTVDFGASDAPMSDAEIAKVKIHPLHFPTVLGGVAVAYNLPALKQPLKLDAPTVAAIYMMKITKWNDKAIAATNPGVKLPDTDIAVAHRAEGSGTTYIFTEWLTKAAPEWAKGPGTSKQPKWPGGIGQQGNEQVAGFVKRTEGAIGYVEHGYVLLNHMQSALIKNANGEWVAPTNESVSAAAAAAAKGMPADFRVSITDAKGKGAYPAASFTWLLIPSQIADAKKKDAIVGFLKWMLGPGQQYCVALGYAPLPKPVVDLEMKQISKIQ